MKLSPLYTIADSGFGDPVDLAEKLFAAGATLLQIRAKDASSRELLRIVRAVVSLAPPEAIVIVNDRADIAREAGAHGVHLGQQDLPPGVARKIVGPTAIVGYSTHNATQVAESRGEPVDYIAFGPVYGTTTKENADPVVGLGALAHAVQASITPVVAIGGITIANAPAVWKTGAQSVAVISDILSATDIPARVRAYLESLQSS